MGFLDVYASNFWQSELYQSYMDSDMGIHSIFVVAAMWTQICNSSEEDNTITDDAFDDRNLIRTLISILQE